jgi:hypothetical protein
MVTRDLVHLHLLLHLLSMEDPRLSMEDPLRRLLLVCR